MNKRSTNNISNNQEPVNTDSKPLSLSQLHNVKPVVKGKGLPDPIPELIGLSAGDKQRWNNAHLDEILSDFERFGPEWTKARYNMAESTLGRVLARAEKRHRKTYSLADRAMNKGKQNEVNIDRNTSDINHLTDIVFQHIDDDESRWNDVSKIFQVLEVLSGQLKERFKVERNNSSGLHKECSANLGSNFQNLEQKSLNTEKTYTKVETPASAGGSVHLERLEQTPGNPRGLLIHTEEPGRTPLLPGPKKTRLSPKERYLQSKFRRRGRV